MVSPGGVEWRAVQYWKLLTSYRHFFFQQNFKIPLRVRVLASQESTVLKQWTPPPCTPRPKDSRCLVSVCFTAVLGLFLSSELKA